MSPASPPPPVPVAYGTASGSTVPGVAVMWVNAALSWAVLPFVYLLYLTARNVIWASSNQRPTLRYWAPLATIALLVGALIVL